MKKVYVHSFTTRFGAIRVAATDKGLAVIALPGESQQSFHSRVADVFGDHEVVAGGAINRQAQQEITDYLDGRLKRFTVKLDLHGSPFRQKVLKRVSGIPYGRTMTYGAIARALGSPCASRAVGMANARNNLPLVIPCHRVIAANGLGGYGGGLELKKRLLKLEGALP
ncbi:MAG: methylated-DNA--[protein]-cysteine S-methyltransferase [Candidatus Zixiibacteriota bacterium]